MPETQYNRPYDPIQADVERGRYAGIIAAILIIVAALCCAGFLRLAAWNAEKDWWPELTPTPSATPSEEVTYDWFPE